ncbi:MAG: hypothetical protein LBK18_02940, partial [Prevotellaceae bacterium]|nr:hypothetical protein [Prevotellaceae bacterium]
MVIRIKNFMAYAAAMPMALLAALPAGAQSVDNAADAFQRERKYSVDNPLPPPSFYYGAKKAMEYADRLSGSADVRAFV